MVIFYQEALLFFLTYGLFAIRIGSSCGPSPILTGKDFPLQKICNFQVYMTEFFTYLIKSSCFISYENGKSPFSSPGSTSNFTYSCIKCHARWETGDCRAVWRYAAMPSLAVCPFLSCFIFRPYSFRPLHTKNSWGKEHSSMCFLVLWH